MAPMVSHGVIRSGSGAFAALGGGLGLILVSGGVLGLIIGAGYGDH